MNYEYELKKKIWGTGKTEHNSREKMWTLRNLPTSCTSRLYIAPTLAHHLFCNITSPVQWGVVSRFPSDWWLIRESQAVLYRAAKTSNSWMILLLWLRSSRDEEHRLQEWNHNMTKLYIYPIFTVEALCEDSSTVIILPFVDIVGGCLV